MTYLKLLKAIAAAIWILLVPIHPALVAVMLLPAVDLALALISTRKSRRKITSGGLKRTVAKVCMYELATILAFITETYLLSGLVPAVKLVTGLIGMTELKSCLEHLDDLGGSPLFAKILRKLSPDQPADGSDGPPKP